MATPIQNISGVDRTVAWLGGRLVLAGAVIDVPDEDVEAYVQQESIWALHDEKKTPAKRAAAHKEG